MLQGKGVDTSQGTSSATYVDFISDQMHAFMSSNSCDQRILNLNVNKSTIVAIDVHCYEFLFVGQNEVT